MTRETTYDKPARLTIRDGGWVLILMGVICTSLVAWAVAPAVMRTANRPPGDGENIASYGFDLTDLRVDRDLISPAMLHRDMLPHWDNPPTYAGDEVADINAERREQHLSKYLVSGDRVIGVVRNGEARAYPISVLYVHEIVNDTLGGESLAITYNWLTDTPRVYRRAGATAMLRTSGLVYNGAMLLYGTDDETLYQQMTGERVAGTGDGLVAVPAQQMSWGRWLSTYPDTTVIAPDAAQYKRYKKATPTEYFLSEDLPFPVDPVAPTDVIGLKDRIVATRDGDAAWRVYPVDMLVRQADDVGLATLDGRTFAVDKGAQTAWLIESDDQIFDGFWFAWFTLHGAEEHRIVHPGSDGA